MYSRRAFLTGMFLFIPFMLAPTRLISDIYNNPYTKRSEKFIKQGWVLQEGDA